MDRNTAVTTWREVCGSDTVMAMPPTGRMLEEFARRIAEAEREACARVAWQELLKGDEAIAIDVSAAIRARSNYK